MVALDLEFVRSNFPAFGLADGSGAAFFENAGGSFACRQTIEALTDYYTTTKVQPYAAYPSSAAAGEQMDRSHRRWAEALGVATDEVQFGPSTSINTYVLAHAFADIIGPGDEVVVTNQDHEANTGAIRRMVEATGATLVEWRIDPATGLLDLDRYASLLTDRTRLVTAPHCSNIVGQENPIADVTRLAHERNARVIVDGVSFAPHTFPDVAALDADVYLFSLYKTYSVHQGLMVTRNGILDDLPNQGHFFNAELPNKRLTPAGPDHAQEAAAGAVLDYVEDLAAHQRELTGAASSSGDGLRADCDLVSGLWRDHETSLVQPVLDQLAESPKVRLLGPATTDHGLHRCPTIAFAPLEASPEAVAQALVDRGIKTSSGHYYAHRVLSGMDVDPDRGVVRVSWVHYTSPDDIALLQNAMADVL